MAWEKTYSRVRWENLPSVQTPIDEVNLNKGDNALNIIDDRVIELQRTKADQEDILACVGNILYNSETGEITVIFNDGREVIYDTVLEKVAVNFDYDEDPTSAHYKSLIITLDDGTQKCVDLSSLITEWEFRGSGALDVNVAGNVVTFFVKNQSIAEEYIDPELMAKIENAANNAESSAEDAEDFATNARIDAGLAESYAIGNETAREGSSTDNAKYYKEQAALIEQAAEDIRTAIQTMATSVESDRDIVQAERQLVEAAEHAIAVSESNAQEYAENAQTFAINAAESASSSKTSEDNAKESEENTKQYYDDTKEIADNLNDTIDARITERLEKMKFGLTNRGFLTFDFEA